MLLPTYLAFCEAFRVYQVFSVVYFSYGGTFLFIPTSKGPNVIWGCITALPDALSGKEPSRIW